MAQPRPIDLNTLPERYRPRRIPTLVVIAILTAALLALGLIPAYTMLAVTRNQTIDAQASLDQIHVDLTQSQALQAEMTNLNQQIEKARVQLADVQAGFGSLSQGYTPRSTTVATIVASTNPGVYIDTISQEGDTFVVTGEAGSQTLVLYYTETLQNSGQFASVHVLSMVNVDPLGIAPEIEFTIAMEQ